MFNKNIIKPGDDEEYIEEAADAIAILRANKGVTVRVICQPTLKYP